MEKEFTAPSIVREAIAYAILEIQLEYLPKDTPEKLRQKTLERYYPIFQDHAMDYANAVYDWFVARGPIVGDLELAKRRLFLELWQDERFEDLKRGKGGAMNPKEHRISPQGWVAYGRIYEIHELWQVGLLEQTIAEQHALVALSKLVMLDVFALRVQTAMFSVWLDRLLQSNWLNLRSPRLDKNA